MKPEVQPKRPKTPPPELIPDEPPFFSAEGFQKNRPLFLGVGAALAVVLLGLAGFGIRNFLVASANAKGWAAYAPLHQGLSIDSSSANPEKKPEDIIKDIEGALPEIRGTSAEPWVLFDLGNAYFSRGDREKKDIESARSIFLDLKTRFPHHVLVDPTSSYRKSSRVEGAIEDCDKELEWITAHGAPAPKPSKTDSSGAGPGSTGSTQDSSGSTNAPKSDTPAPNGSEPKKP